MEEVVNMSGRLRRIREINGVVDMLRDRISEKLHSERKKGLAEAKRRFRKEAARVTELEKELEELRSEIVKAGFCLDSKGDLEVASIYGRDLPEGVERELCAIRELAVLGREEEMTAKIDSLAKRFGLGQ
jgi:hypothetical protein